MVISEVETARARRAISLYRRGVRAVEICNLLFPELNRLSDAKKRDFVCRLLSYHGFNLSYEERSARVRMYQRSSNRKQWKSKSKWTMR